MIDIKVEIGKYVNYFEKKNIQERGIKGIQELLNSREYSNFINTVYDYYNSKVKSINGFRLDPRCYVDAKRTIDQFWDLLLDDELKTEFISNLKKKLKL